MNTFYEIADVCCEDGLLTLTVDGQTVVRGLKELSPRLASASMAARKNFEISPSGYGIHWPDCDEDISVDALMGVQHTSPMIAAEESAEYKTKTN